MKEIFDQLKDWLHAHRENFINDTSYYEDYYSTEGFFYGVDVKEINEEALWAEIDAFCESFKGGIAMNNKYIIHVEDDVICVSKLGRESVSGFYFDMQNTPENIAQEIYELLASANFEVEFGEED